jgi:predicted PurR-regulated permease PerM
MAAAAPASGPERERGEAFTRLSAETIGAVAQGVVGVALIQAILVGLCLMVAGVPGPAY